MLSTPESPSCWRRNRTQQWRHSNWGKTRMFLMVVMRSAELRNMSPACESVAERMLHANCRESFCRHSLGCWSRVSRTPSISASMKIGWFSSYSTKFSRPWRSSDAEYPSAVRSGDWDAQSRVLKAYLISSGMSFRYWRCSVVSAGKRKPKISLDRNLASRLGEEASVGRELSTRIFEMITGKHLGFWTQLYRILRTEWVCASSALCSSVVSTSA